MRAIIKDGRTFATKTTAPVLDYEIHESIYDTISTVTIPQTLTISAGDIIYIDCLWIGVVRSIATEDMAAVLSCSQIISIFGRPVFWEPATYTYIEDYVLSLVDAQYTQCPDNMYAIPYLTATTTTHTRRSITPSLEDGCYSVKGYLNQLRRTAGLIYSFAISTQALTLSLTTYTGRDSTRIDCDNPAYRVAENNFSVAAVAKITAKAEDTGAISTWVRLTDGSIVQGEPTANRAQGEWITLLVPEAADVEDEVKNKFAENQYAHKITLQCASSRAFALYDPVTVKINGSVCSSYISGIVRTKSSEIMTLELGELQTTYPYLALA